MSSNTSDANMNGNNDQLFEDRRKFVRLSIGVEVSYSLLDGKDTKQSATTKDIAAGGICLLVDTQLKKGDVVKLEIVLPEFPPRIYATGRIVWVKPFSMEGEKKPRFDVGIEFLAIDPKDRELINKYVFSLKIR